MARAALEAGQWIQAEARFAALVRQAPGLIDAHHGLAEALVGQGRAAEGAAVLAPLGHGLAAAGRYPEAAAALARTVELAPERAAEHAALGRALLLAQRHEAAIAPLERALALGWPAPTVELYLGSALWETGRLDAAEEMFRSAASRPGAGGAALYQLGRLLHWRGRSGEALAALEAARAAGSGGVDFELDFARAAGGAGDEATALAAYRRVVALDPEQYGARHGLARLLLRRGERDEAKLHLEVYQRLLRAEQDRLRREGLERARLEAAWHLLSSAETSAATEEER